ncbi:MAG: NYN domain-containing protein [Nitriliruptoraceae bacterium]|nr:NYN domain-containing protein [Nitriliruptoraceae bacterium]
MGRPSRLPAEVVAGTTEAARLLLHRGRRVLVDGYNVTKQHQGSLTLEGQRAWLVRLLATLVARRGVAPTIVFDGQVSSGGRPPMGAREVAVVFTPAGITADDEIVLAVDATDEPIVVVSDDRELVARVRALGADVLDTRSFLGAAS